MTFQEFITKKVIEAAKNGYYRIDVKSYRECWDAAHAEGVKEGRESILKNI